MSQAEVLGEYGLPTLSAQPREELVSTPQLYVPFDISERTTAAVDTVHTMFGGDKGRTTAKVGESMQGLFDALTADRKVGDQDVETIPAAWLIEEFGLTFSAVVRGHDKLRSKDGQPIPETAIWPQMWRDRSANYLNRRLRGEDQLSALGGVPLRALAMELGGDREDAPGLHLTDKKWEVQQKAAGKHIEGYNQAHERTIMEGFNPVDWMMADSQRIVGGLPRLDVPTFTRFVQHERDVSGAGRRYGPLASSRDGRAGLDGSGGVARPGVGVRFLVGPKPETLAA